MHPYNGHHSIQERQEQISKLLLSFLRPGLYALCPDIRGGRASGAADPVRHVPYLHPIADRSDFPDQ